MAIFDKFGKASWLLCKWTGTKAALISNSGLPVDLLQLGWVWESGLTSTKLLGFFFSDGLSPELMVEQLSKILNDRLTTAKSKKLSFMARVVIINHWIQGAIWFILALCVGSPQQLKALQSIIIKFLWAGEKESARHRVDILTITSPKSQGGVALISLTDQGTALASKLVLWATEDDVHPLQCILQGKIQELSFRRWGTRDFS